MEIKRSEFDDRKRRISMDEKINLEKLHIEKMSKLENKGKLLQVSKPRVKEIWWKHF